MKKYINQIIDHPFFSGSIIMILGSNVTNFLNYLYHLFMGRLLGPVFYGELASLITLLGLLGLVPSFLGIVVVKFISGSKEDQKINGLVYLLNRKLLFLGLLLIVLSIFLANTISSYLKINNSLLVILIAVSYLFYLQSLLYKSVLQGLLKFNKYIYSQLSENVSKLLIGILLVYLGFSILGASIGLLISVFVGWLISRIYIKKYLTGSRVSPAIGNLVVYSFPVFVQSLSSISMYSSDLILVKHFFQPFEAGLYAGLSTLGRIIFFACGPILSVMFPLVSKKHSNQEKYNKVFVYSLLLTLTISLVVLIIYGLFPKLMILILYGPKYLDGSYLLLKFGIFMSLFTISNLIVTFYLAIGKTKIVYLQLLAAILQVIGISLIHNSLESVIMVSIAISLLLFLSLLFIYSVNYFLKNEK